MAVFQDAVPSVIPNTVFYLWKTAGKSMRLIQVVKILNHLLQSEASSGHLPTPDLMDTLRIEADVKVCLVACEVKKKNNILKVPPELVPLFGCPRVLATVIGHHGLDLWVGMFLTARPMNATFAVTISQRVTTAAVLADSSSFTKPITHLPTWETILFL